MCFTVESRHEAHHAAATDAHDTKSLCFFSQVGCALGRAILIGENHTWTLRRASGRNVVKAMSTLTVKNHMSGWRSGGVRGSLALFSEGELPPVTGGSA